MRQLLLLRHAKSSWHDAALADHDRPLDSDGQAACPEMREHLLRLAGPIGLVLVSTARRTRETLELVQPLPGTPRVERAAGLYLASPHHLLDHLRAIPSEIERVLLVGHNPGLHDLGMILAGAHAASGGDRAVLRLAQGLPTAGLMDFAVAGNWRDLPEGARLLHFHRPGKASEAAL